MKEFIGISMDILIFWYVDSLSKLFRNRLVELSGFFIPIGNSFALSKAGIDRFQGRLSWAQIFLLQCIQGLIYGVDHVV